MKDIEYIFSRPHQTEHVPSYQGIIYVVTVPAKDSESRAVCIRVQHELAPLWANTRLTPRSAAAASRPAGRSPPQAAQGRLQAPRGGRSPSRPRRGDSRDVTRNHNSDFFQTFIAHILTKKNTGSGQVRSPETVCWPHLRKVCNHARARVSTDRFLLFSFS